MEAKCVRCRTLTEASRPSRALCEDCREKGRRDQREWGLNWAYLQGAAARERWDSLPADVKRIAGQSDLTFAAIASKGRRIA